MLSLQGGPPVTPICHIESAPRVPGCERGHAPKQYPAGRICVACPTVLRRTNPGPWCDPCLSKDHRIPHEDAKARARATVTKEKKVGKESLREAVLLAFARDPSRCFNAEDVVKSSGVSPSCVYKNLSALVASGEIVKDAPGVYHWPTLVPLGVYIEDVKTAPDSPPVPAPSTSGEQPANEAPAPELLRPQAGLAPFAGIDVELLVIGEVVGRIESLTGHETRVRVAAYVASRFL